MLQGRCAAVCRWFHVLVKGSHRQLRLGNCQACYGLLVSLASILHLLCPIWMYLSA